MYQIAVCDDREDEAKALISCIRQYASESKKEVRVLYYPSGEALLETFGKGKTEFALIFLDIFMDGINGIETAKDLRLYDRRVPIVFLTTSRDYAVESYEVNAAGYLLKPFQKHRVEEYLKRFLKESKRLAVRSRYSYQYLDYDEIRYVESGGHMLEIHLEQETITTAGKLGELEEQLSDPRFLRCHQSYLVNMDYVHRVKEEFILRDGTRVPIRIKEKRRITESYYRYFVEKSLPQMSDFDV